MATKQATTKRTKKKAEPNPKVPKRKYLIEEAVDLEGYPVVVIDETGAILRLHNPVFSEGMHRASFYRDGHHVRMVQVKVMTFPLDHMKKEIEKLLDEGLVDRDDRPEILDWGTDPLWDEFDALATGDTDKN